MTRFIPPVAATRFLGSMARLAAAAACGVVFLATAAEAQVVVVEPLPPVPMAAGFPGGYVANYSYSPAGNYAAVTAFSPPVAVPSVAGYTVAAPPATVSVTSFYAPTAVTAYAPVVQAAVPAYAPVVAAPVTTYYAPAAVAVPLYRRGLFGGLRPVRSAMYIPY